MAGYLYTGFLIAMIGGAIAISNTGGLLPGPDNKSTLSLKNDSLRGQSRRAFFFASYWHGK